MYQARDYWLVQIADFMIAPFSKSRKAFAIKSSAPSTRVSWQVTGVRKDAWAIRNRIPIEEAKPDIERGSYLHSEVFSKAEASGVLWKLYPETMKRSKAERKKSKAETGELLAVGAIKSGTQA